MVHCRLVSVALLGFLNTTPGCNQPRADSDPFIVREGALYTRAGTEVKTEFLTHGSQEILIKGWTKDRVLLELGRPSITLENSFERPKYGKPAGPLECDEQWVYRRSLEHEFIFFHEELVVLAISEWTDW